MVDRFETLHTCCRHIEISMKFFEAQVLIFNKIMGFRTLGIFSVGSRHKVASMGNQILLQFLMDRFEMLQRY